MSAFSVQSNGPATTLKSATTNVDVAAATAPSAGQYLVAVDSTHATWQTAAPGGVGGSTGATANRILRASGTGGATLQNSAISLDDNGATTNHRRAVTSSADGDAITSAMSRRCFVNSGAVASVTVTLPASVAGLEYMFVVAAAFNFVAVAAGSDVIRVGASVSTAGGSWTSSTVGTAMLLTCAVAGTWTGIQSGVSSLA